MPREFYRVESTDRQNPGMGFNDLRRGSEGWRCFFFRLLLPYDDTASSNAFSLLLFDSLYLGL